MTAAHLATDGRLLVHHDVECRPRRPCTPGAQERSTSALATRELVVGIPTQRRNHRQDEAATLPNQFAINSGIGLANGLRYMSEIELDRATTTRLEIDKQQPSRSRQQIRWVRLAMQQLFG